MELLSSKQRSWLAAQANDLDAIFQIGKSGMSDEMVKQIGIALDKRELVKITVLKSAREDREAGDFLRELAERLQAEPVKAIGGKITVYREAKEKTDRRFDLKYLRLIEEE